MAVSKIAEATSTNATLVAKAQIGSSTVKFKAIDKREKAKRTRIDSQRFQRLHRSVDGNETVHS